MRLPVGTIIGPESGNIPDFNLASFCDELATTRTRSRSRQLLIKQTLEQLYGFEIGLIKLRKERTKYEFSISVGTVSQGLATIDTSKGIDDGLRRKLEKSELMLSDANRELASLKVALEAAQKSESAAKVNANEANRHTADIQDKITAFNRTIDQLQLDLSAAQANAENAESREVTGYLVE